MWNPVVSKPEKCKIEKKSEFEFSRKEKNSFTADTKLQVDQIQGKMVANFNEPFFI